MSTEPKLGDEKARNQKRLALRNLNDSTHDGNSAKLDSSLKRHTALIKRMKLSMTADNRDPILRELDGLTLERYLDELAQASLEGLAKCKLEKDVWGAVEIISALHRRFHSYSATFLRLLTATLAAPSAQVKANLATLAPEQREKEDSVRIQKQRPLLRVACELVLVGVIRDPGAEWIIKVLKELLSNDPTLSSLPLLSTFLKSYAYPFLGIMPGGTIEGDSEPDVDLVEPEMRERFKRMCEGYFDTVSKKLVIEHRKLQALDARNHEAYIRSGEIFEDRQQAYEKAARGYEKIAAGCGSLSDLLGLPLPILPTSDTASAAKIGVNTNPSSSLTNNGEEDDFIGGNKKKWVDEEERKFYEDIADLKDFIPRSVLGIEEDVKQEDSPASETAEAQRSAEETEDEEVRKLQEELDRLGTDDNSKPEEDGEEDDAEEEDSGTATPKPSLSPVSPMVPLPGLPATASDAAATAPAEGDLPSQSQMLTALLARLPDCTSRQTIDTAAIDFAFLNSKAARKRLVKFLSVPPKNRLDLLPYYARLVAILSKYMPDVGIGLIAALDEEFRYLQKKRKVVVELAESRLRNTTYITHMVKFGLAPPHVILHMIKVCLDTFAGTSIDVLTMLIEGCGRFLLRDQITGKRFAAMLELCRRKMKIGGLDERRIMGLENAYYQCNPPDRPPRIEKPRSDIELFVRHLIFDVLTKKTLDKVLKLLRKLDWTGSNLVQSTATAQSPLRNVDATGAESNEEEPSVPPVPTTPPPHIPTLLHKLFTKPHKQRFSQVPLMAMLLYDLQRYHPEFVIGVVDHVLEKIRLGLEGRGFGISGGGEANGTSKVVGGGTSGSYGYEMNQQRVAEARYIGEMYVYRLVGSGVIFDLLWRLVTFGHIDGRPLPHVHSPLDMPDDFFRIRLVCVLLDTCGMCFDRGPQRKKLDNFLVFFQYYVHCKSDLPMDIDFMLQDSLEAVRPSFVLVKTIEEAAVAVDEMLSSAFQGADPTVENDESGDESGNEDDPNRRDGQDDDEDEETTSPTTPTANNDLNRPSSPEEEDVIISTNTSHQENLGPSEEADAEFAKELAKLVTESSTERKVDKKTALAMLESNMIPTSMRRKKGGAGWDESAYGEDEEQGRGGGEMMKFTVVTKKGNRQQTRQLAVPSTSALAVHTRSAQLQDKVEQQQLKQLVLNYEQREELEERKALEARNRAGAIKIRYVG